MGAAVIAAPHPWTFIRGHLAKLLTSPAGTEPERQQYLTFRSSDAFERMQSQIFRAIQAQVLKPFTGSGTVRDFNDWKTSVLEFCAQYFITNTLVQAIVAQRTLAERARSWWAAHRTFTPMRLYSYAQMVEWVSLELAPSAYLEAGHMAWTELQYKGNLKDYFRQARDLLMQYPMTPLAGHLMATRQFGNELHAELRAAHARAGPRGILDEHWEAIVTAYVRRLERTPGFLGWSDVRGGPRFKSTQFVPRSNHIDVNEANQEEAAPLTEEEQTARIHAIDSGPKKDAPPARIGIGPRPCFCCGSDAHSWIQCPKKVSGKCGVCGSQEYPTFRCYKKFNPAPSARVNCVVSLPVDQIPEGVTVCETQPSGKESVLPTTPADPCLAPEGDVRVNHAKVAETPSDPFQS